MKVVDKPLNVMNGSKLDSRQNRYRSAVTQDITGECYAEKHGFDVIGVFHSHPDHPAQPSDFEVE